MFVEGIESGIQPEISGEEGLKALDIILACMKASVEGKSINL